MKKQVHLLSTLLIVLGGVTACVKEKVVEKPVYTDTHVEYESSDLPEKIPFNGGIYTVKFEKKAVVTKADTINTDLPWAWRVNYGSGAQYSEVVEVTPPYTGEIQVEIEGNFTINTREVVFEVSLDREADTWEDLIHSTQESALVQIGEDDVVYFYAKSNLTVRNGKWALADHSYDPGMQFARGDLHAIPSEDYKGTAYSPEAETFALADLVDTGADPCTALSPKLRLPSYEEFYNLFYMEDGEDASPLEGVNGIRYRDTDYFMPYSGYVNKVSGSFIGANAYGAWWGLGGDIEGCGLIYAGDLEKTYIAYDYVGENLASVRCVRNIALPTYVSHSPVEIIDSKQTGIEITTNPGDFPVYKVSIVADYGLEKSADAAQGKPVATVILPENTDKEPVTWTIFVNGISSGVSFVQPAMSDYALYVSHSPKEEQGPESFDLTVKIDTDRESVKVEAKSSKDAVVSATASKDAPEVTLTIPENTDATPTTWTIYLDGESTGITVQQAKADVKGLSVEWSTGCLTVKNGQFTFAEPNEQGYLFRWKSKYAINVTPASPKYPGVVYAPEETSIAAYADIPYGEDDPCALVAPAGTWRMPTVAEFTELSACDYSITVKEKAVFTLPDGKELVFIPTGQYDNSKFVSAGVVVMLWASDEASETQGNYLMLSTSKTDSKPSPAAKMNKTKAVQVRCVKSNK